MYEYSRKLIDQFLKEGNSKDKHIYFRFVAIWIAFNHWLVVKFQKDSDGELLKEFYKGYADYFKKEVNLNANLKESIKKLSEKTPVHDERPTHRNDTKKIDTLDDLKQVFGVIYLIRCNLMHGSKRFDASRDDELVNLSHNILNKLFTKLIGEEYV